MTATKLLWGPAIVGPTPSNTALGARALNDADNAAAGVLALPKAGTITHVGFYVSAIAGTPPAYNVGLVTIDTAGAPTTTAYGGGANTTDTPGAIGWRWVALASPATAVAGDFAAVHVWPGASPPDASNYISLVNDGLTPGGYTPYYTTSWQYNSLSLFAVKYQDGSIAGNALSSNTVHLSVRSNTTPDELGCKFSLPATMQVNGVRFYTPPNVWGSSAQFEVIIYSALDQVLVTKTVSDKDFMDNTAAGDVYFAPITLQANTAYRVVIKPTVSTGGDIYLQRYQFESANAKAAWPPADSAWQGTSRTDGGAWTDQATELTCIGLWVNDLTLTAPAGAGGGASAHL